MSNNEGIGARWLTLAALVLILAGLVSCLAQPASAKGAPTVTPLPGPVATATAAAVQLADVQAQQQHAAELDAEAQRLRQDADTRAAAAQQAVNDSRVALAAQQFTAAAEAIGRAESDIASLRDNGAQRDSVITQQAGIIATLTAANTQQVNELTVLRADNAQLKTANNGLQVSNRTLTAQAADSQRSGGVNSIVLFFVALMFLIILIGFTVWLLSRRAAVAPMIIPSAGYTVSHEAMQPDPAEDDQDAAEPIADAEGEK